MRPEVFKDVREMAEWLVGEDAGAADMAMAEALCREAISVTPRLEDEGAMGEAVGRTLGGFLILVLNRRMAELADEVVRRGFGERKPL